jgi:hypothetical protein
MPLIADAAMSIPADLSMRYAIYTFEKQYTRWGAVFPGNFVPLLTWEGKCSRRRAKPAHFGRHLPYGFLCCSVTGLPARSALSRSALVPKPGW